MSNLDSLILHPRTQLILDMAISNPPHALILVGSANSGKSFLANQIAKHLLDDDVNAKFNQITIHPDEKGTISIDVIRQLYQDTQSRHTTKQVITIVDAEGMGEPAQNAFLKLLEEPPANVYFIITIKSTKNILPTIISRSQILPVLPVNKHSLEQLSKKYPNHSEQEIAHALLKTGGKMGALDSIFNQPQSDLTEMAKQMLLNEKSERIIQMQKISTDKDRSVALLQAMLNVANAAAQASAAKDLHAQTQSWFKRIELISTALNRLENHGNTKIQLLNVLYNL